MSYNEREIFNARNVNLSMLFVRGNDDWIGEGDLSSKIKNIFD